MGGDGDVGVVGGLGIGWGEEGHVGLVRKGSCGT